MSKPIGEQFTLIVKLLVPLAYVGLGVFLIQAKNNYGLGTLAGIKTIIWLSSLFIIYGLFRAWRAYVAMKSDEKK
jgi:hypothetical protein